MQAASRSPPEISDPLLEPGGHTHAGHWPGDQSHPGTVARPARPQGSLPFNPAPLPLTPQLSGSFRAARGAERLATVRSHIQTDSKHGVAALDVLTALFAGEPWMPPAPTRT